ncbi:MAG: aminodeoxychorismate synthase component I [Gammaproteobacteria bacterium]|nr:aminodeoxychorismate synthase component I [Gammaproteobacteria bacterium]
MVAARPQRYPGLLESVAVTETAVAGERYDLLPICSGEVLCATAADRSGEGFLAELDRRWRALSLSDPPPASPEADPPGDALPFRGGWLIYLGYELAAEIEPRLVLPESPDPFVGLAFRAPAAWLRDRSRGRAWLIAEQGFEGLLEEFLADVTAFGEPPDAAPPLPAVEIEEEDPGRFLQAVRRALEYTAAGEVYQTNLSRRWSGTAIEPLDPVALYQRLRMANPSPFAALLRYGEFAVQSSSPERLLSIRGDRVSTRPIAGTRPRGATARADAELVSTLLRDEKERAEHVMLIDLERNDLGRVCRGGTVEVDEFMSIETYAHVHHIVSNVRGRLRAGVSPVEALRAVFPGGTITGCPKVRCMQIIAELEGGGRGAYTGSIGYLNRDGSADFNILIRTFTTHGPRLAFRAGAGIVADSQPERELAETRAKAKGLLRALGRDP